VGLVSGWRPIDPFPFSFLTLVVSLEAIFLSIFVLVSQNNLTRQSERRAHLDLQINLLAEQESTKTVALLERIAAHLHVPIPTDPSECELAAPTTFATWSACSIARWRTAPNLPQGVFTMAQNIPPSNVPYGRGRTIPSVAELESARQGLPRTSHRGTDDQPPPANMPKPRPLLARVLME
jgi:Protein of unknown function (DUF1003)